MADKKSDPVVSEEDAALAAGFVKVAKEGVVSYVHPSTVAAHEAVGWRVV